MVSAPTAEAIPTVAVPALDEAARADLKWYDRYFRSTKPMFLAPLLGVPAPYPVPVPAPSTVPRAQ